MLDWRNLPKISVSKILLGVMRWYGSFPLLLGE